MTTPITSTATSAAASTSNIQARNQISRTGQIAFFSSLVVAIIALILLLLNIINSVAGLIIVDYEINPSQLSDKPIEELTREELVPIIEANANRNIIRRINRDAGRPFEADLTFAQLLEPWSDAEILTFVEDEVVGEQVLESFSLYDSLFNRAMIDADVAELAADNDGITTQWKSWLNPRFLVVPMSQTPWLAGVRSAILGTFYMILITILFAVPVGVGAAIYLEEYGTGESAIERIIQTNIANLAGVPSIIYGMLGLTIFVRMLGSITQGSTVLSAGLTMGLLILPIIIISSQEAIRAVPRSLRLASFGLGATRWQTVWSHVLPSALPGILTGVILSVSRAIGETAPLIVIGAATFIASDPTFFSGFTVLPIQIFNWTSQPAAEFRNIAAAAIIVLLVMLLTLNSVAILLRNRFQVGR